MRRIVSGWAPRKQGRKALASVFAVIVVVGMAATLAACGGSNAGTSSSAGVTINVKVAHGQGGSTVVILPVTINGKGPFDFALDTGASTSLIDTPLAQRLNLAQNGTPNPIAGVSGTEVAVPVLVNTWSVEQIKLPKMTVQSANLFSSQRGAGLKGLIGSDIWNRFGAFTLNYSGGTLTVPKQIAGISNSTPVSLVAFQQTETRKPSAALLPRAA